MMRSLSSAVAGLRTHQTKMDVIGNNIANVNTYGFKASRTTFSDVYYQNLASGKKGTATSGGKNPTQIGYGASVATIDVMNTITGAATTDKWSDVYITGEGFLVSKDATGKITYSRLGNLDFDSAGNLVDGNGRLIQGFPMKMDANGDLVPDISPNGTVNSGQLQNISIDPDLLLKMYDISINSSGAIIGLIKGDPTIKANPANPGWINGNTMSIPATSVYNGSVRFAVSGLPDKDLFASALGLNPGDISGIDMGTLALPESAGTTVGYTITANANGTVTISRPKVGDADPVELTGAIKNGQLVFTNKRGDVAMTVNFKEPKPTSIGEILPPGKPLDMSFHYQMTTTDKGGNTIKVPENGPQLYPPAGGVKPLSLGELSFEITAAVPKAGFNGVIGTAGPGDPVVYHIGNLVIAKFQNAGGLQQAGSSYFEETLNSGEPVFVMPGLEGTGPLKSGYLEMSNVDVSKEFTDMITTQRGFQANSRIITVSDEMLQELVNLKR